MKIIIQLLLIVTFFSCKVYEKTNYHKENKEVTAFVNKKIEELKISGLAFAIIKDGKVIHQSVFGYGNIEWQNKITKHSCFQIASSTKLITSTLLLKSIYNNRIDLNEPVAKYLDSIPNEWAEISIKNLIGHSSGIPDLPETFSYYVSKDSAFKQIKKMPLLYKPGTQARYGQAEFLILSYILEKIYKKPYAQIIVDEVLKPLNMVDGGYDMEFKIGSSLGVGGFLQTNIINEKVTTYYDNNGKLLSYKYLYPQFYYSAAGLFASIADMSNWAIGLDNNALFPSSFSDSLIYKQDDKALFSKVGWVITKEDGILSAGHPGGPGLGDILRFPNEKITIITLSNDGELLPGFSRVIASWYVKGLSAKYDVKKFDR